jgi:hypothetical protein
MLANDFESTAASITAFPMSAHVPQQCSFGPSNWRTAAIPPVSHVQTPPSTSASTAAPTKTREVDAKRTPAASMSHVPQEGAVNLHIGRVARGGSVWVSLERVRPLAA